MSIINESTVFPGEPELAYHNMVAHYEEMKVAKQELKYCPESDCGYSSNNKSDLKDHINSRHIHFYSSRCEVCQETFFTRRNYNRHRKIHHRQELMELVEKGASVKRPRMEGDDDDDEGSAGHRFFPPAVNESTIFPGLPKQAFQAMLNHYKRLKVCKQDVIKCPETNCQYTCNNKTDLKGHINSRHIHYRVISCTICGECFYTQKAAHSHRKNRHPDAAASSTETLAHDLHDDDDDSHEGEDSHPHPHSHSHSHSHLHPSGLARIFPEEHDRALLEERAAPAGLPSHVSDSERALEEQQEEYLASLSSLSASLIPSLSQTQLQLQHAVQVPSFSQTSANASFPQFALPQLRAAASFRHLPQPIQSQAVPSLFPHLVPSLPFQLQLPSLQSYLPSSSQAPSATIPALAASSALSSFSTSASPAPLLSHLAQRAPAAAFNPSEAIDFNESLEFESDTLEFESDPLDLESESLDFENDFPSEKPPTSKAHHHHHHHLHKTHSKLTDAPGSASAGRISKATRKELRKHRGPAILPSQHPGALEVPEGNTAQSQWYWNTR